MAVTDLTGTTWIINSTPVWSPFTGLEAIYSLNFRSNSQSFSQINFVANKLGTALSSISFNTVTSVYGSSGGWVNEAYRTIEITGGSNVTNANLIGWLEANAEQFIPVDDVVISYNGSDIASMTDSGTKTLLTADSYCENNIVVTYTKPAAPAPNLQAKTNITPTTSSQTITADSGYDGLSSVQIKAMPSGSARTPTTTFYPDNLSYYIDEWGTLMISGSGSRQITPTITAGYVSSGTAGTVTAYINETYDLTSDGYAFDGTVDDYEEEEEGGGGG